MTPKKPEQQEDKRTLTKEEERMRGEFVDLRTKEEKSEKGKSVGDKISDLYKNQGNNFKEKTFRRVHEIAKDPNKMAKNDYKHLVNGIAEGRIYVGGDLGLHLFNALVETIEGEDDLKKSELHDKLKKIDEGTDSEFIDNKEKAKKETKKLRGKKGEEETAEKVKNVIAETTGTTEEKAEAATETPETNWSIEQPPKELIEQLNNIDKEMLTLAKEDKSLSQQIEVEKRKDVPNIAEIAKLQKRIKEIDEEMEKIRIESVEVKEKWTNYLEKMLHRFRSLRFLSKRAGFDLSKVQKLTTWFLKTAQDPTGGLEIDKETGSANQKREQIKINRIYFEKESSPIIEETSPGQIMVEYSVVEDGKEITVESSYKNFLGQMDTLDGYEDIDSPDYFNEQYGFELGYKNFQGLEGETFAKTGESKDPFKVEKVLKKNGEWYISLDKTAMKTSKHLLPYSIHSSLYFDRMQKDFKLGEFGAFLQKNNYQRDISGDDMQEIVNKSIEARNKECIGFMKGSTPEREEMFRATGGVPDDTVTIPTEGQTQSIYYEDNGKRREAKLVDLGGGEYEIIYTVGYNDPAWGQPGANNTPRISDEEWERIQSPTPASEELPTAAEGAPEPAMAAVLPPRKGYTAKRKKVNAAKLIAMANKGQVQDVEPGQDEPEQPEPEPAQPDEPTYEPIEPGEPGEDEDKIDIPKSDVELAKPKYFEEALSYEEIHKVGGMERVEQGFMKTLWTNSRFLSVSDFWEMGKSMWEYYERRWQRRQKEKYSKIGEELPFFAPEMQRINQSAENEEMGQFKESFDQKGVHEIIERLEKTGNRDEMKAALTVLNEKGQMRWDNIDFWKNINKFVDPSLAIPIPSNGDPNTEMSSTDSRTGFDFMKDAIDSLWGDGQYNEWYRQNKSTHLSNAKSYYEKGKELEGVEGGPGRRLAVLLDTHKRGEFVDPHEYEGLLLFSLDFGKAFMQEKLYYMIEGVAAENMHGRTILSFDRMAHINSEMLHKFPILEYLCASVKREDGGPPHTFTIDDYKGWVKWFDGGNKMNSTPTDAVDEFLWRYAVPNDNTQNRINKDLRNGENLDHDDMFAILPPASTGVLTDACKSTTGSKKFLTVEGYANVFPGFNQYFKSLTEYNYRDKLADAVKSYVRFEGIMNNKFEKAKTSAQDTYQRMDEVTLNNGTIVSDEPPNQFIGELNKVVQKAVAAYENEDLSRLTDIIFNSEPIEDVTTKDGAARQNEINQAYYKFEELFKEVVKSDGGEKLISVVGGSKITGMDYVTPAEKARRKAEFAAK
jgi:hypothetical protein